MTKSLLLEGLEVILIIDSSIGFDESLYKSYQRDLKGKIGCAHIYEFDINTKENDIHDVQSFITRYKKVGVCITMFSQPSSSKSKLIKEFSFYKIASIDLMIPIIDHKWLDDVFRQNKILKTLRSAINPEYFLKDCNFYIDTKEFNEIELHIIQVLINNFGGSFATKDYRSSLVTHILTQNKQLYSGTSEKVVMTSPIWLLDVLLNYKKTIPKEDFSKILNQDLKNNNFQSFLQGKRFVLSKNYSNVFGGDTEINFLFILKKLIELYGGFVEDGVPAASDDIYSIEYRYDTKFSKFKHSNRCNFWWLLDLIKYCGFHDNLENKMIKKILHYPYKDMKMQSTLTSNKILLSFSNFIGVQRFYVQQLMTFLNIPYTLDFSTKNTGLIYYYKSGSKLKYAKAQNITCLNHTYLEYCYKFGKVIDYNTFMNDFENEFMQVDYFGLIGSSFENSETDELALSFKHNVSNSEYDIQESQQPDVSTRSIMNEEDDLNEEIDHVNDNENNMHGLSVASANDSLTVENLEENVLTPTNFNIETKTINDESIKSDNRPEFDLAKETSFKSLEFNKVLSQQSDLLEAELKRQVETQNGQIYDCENIITENSLSQLNASQTKSLDMKAKVEKETPIPLDSSKSSIIEEIKITEHNERLTKESSPGQKAKSETPQTTTISQRRAKQNAAKKMSTDIDKINDFERVSKKQKIDEKGNFINTSLADDGTIQDFENQDKIIPSDVLTHIKKVIFKNGIDGTKNILPWDEPLYCIVTGCQLEDYLDAKNIDLEIRLLSKVGINIILNTAGSDTNHYSLTNCLIAPKKLRTEKFLKSLSLRNLQFIMLPSFLSDVCSILKDKTSIKLPDPNNYLIPDLDHEKLLKQISLLKQTGNEDSSTIVSTNLFAKFNVNNINIIENINGGVNVISSILKAHGVSKINKINEKAKVLDIETDLLENKFVSDFSNSLNKENEHGRFQFKYIFLVNKTSQANNILKNLKKNGIIAAGKKKANTATNSPVLIVEWNWCVKCIFNLEINFNDPEYIIYV